MVAVPDQLDLKAFVFAVQQAILLFDIRTLVPLTLEFANEPLICIVHWFSGLFHS
jgi:hypothetical protein